MNFTIVGCVVEFPSFVAHLRRYSAFTTLCRPFVRSAFCFDDQERTNRPFSSFVSLRTTQSDPRCCYCHQSQTRRSSRTTDPNERERYRRMLRAFDQRWYLRLHSFARRSYISQPFCQHSWGQRRGELRNEPYDDDKPHRVQKTGDGRPIYSFDSTSRYPPKNVVHQQKTSPLSDRRPRAIANSTRDTTRRGTQNEVKRRRIAASLVLYLYSR